MKFRNLIVIGLLALTAMMAPATATAADFDGSKPLLVAIIKKGL